MSHTSMILSVLMSLAVLIYIAPGVFALNHGHILRNIALWLAIFLGLTLIYQNVGPESPHPLFSMPDSMKGMRPMSSPQPAETPKAATDKESKKEGKTSDDKDDSNAGESDFTPPSE